MLLNFRRHYRKQTNLSGTYKIAGEAESGGGIIQINNISSSGVGLPFPDCTGLKRIRKSESNFSSTLKTKPSLKNWLSLHRSGRMLWAVN